MIILDRRRRAPLHERRHAAGRAVGGLTAAAVLLLSLSLFSFSRISQTTVSTRWPKPMCTIPAWPSQ